MAAVPIAVKAGLFSLVSSTSYEYAVEYFLTLSWYPQLKKTSSYNLLAKWHPDMKTVVQFVENWAAWPPMAEAHAVGLNQQV